MMGIQGLYKTKKSWGGFNNLLLVYDALKLSTVCVVKWPVLGLQSITLYVHNLQNWDHKLFGQKPALYLQPFELAYLFLLLPLDFFQTIHASFLNISR